MASVSLRQIRAVIAVCEEASFTRAAAREFATQSGISQRIASLETSLGVKLFERSIDGVRPTPAGACYYQRCLEAVGAIRAASDDIRALQHRPVSCLRIGLICIFATALAPTLKRYMRDRPDVKLTVVEGYSGALIEKLAVGDLDVALVTKFEPRPGLSSRRLVRDCEMLVSGKARMLTPHAPIRLRDIPRLKIVMPGPKNMHHRNLEAYFQANNINVDDVIEMEGIVSTLEFVATTDWVAILPTITCNSLQRKDLFANAIIDPPMRTDFMLVTSNQQALNPQAEHFMKHFKAEVSGFARKPIDGLAATAGLKMRPIANGGQAAHRPKA
jgi:LysR family transcriptional regulator, nitrogen assimilation regulatory protein